jgi:hypothetical protein
MAFVKVRVPRTRQPQELVGIDWSNPLTKGLVLARVPSTDGATLYGSGKIYPRVAGIAAVAPYVGGVNDITFSINGIPTIQGDRSFAVFASNFGHTDGYVTALWSGPDGYDSLLVGATQFSSIFDGNATNILTVAQSENPKLFAARRSGNQATVWCDGAATSNTVTGTRTITPNLLRAGRDGSSTNTQSVVYLFFGWRRYVTDAEFAQINSNPWQIFEPEERLIWIPDAVSAGVGATVIPIGQQATGSVGSPTATGAATTAATGVSAASAIGTPTAIGGASIPATVSPAGVISASSVGTPIATGASITSANGVQAISAVGTPTAIAGTSIPATVTPAGVIAYASVGSLIATGAAWTVPVGVQATSAVGTPTAVAGTSIPATALPAGVYALASVGTPSANGASIAYAGGVSAFSAVGAPTAIGGVSGQATALPDGVQAISYVGMPTVTAAAVVYAYEVQAIGYVGMPIALGDPVAFTPSVYQAISPAQSYTAISPAQSYTVTVQPQTYIA